jgi:hypothetical protein
VSIVVLDASAGVEIVADTVTGRALRALLPDRADLWVPEHFYAECGAVFRKWGNGGLLTAAQLERLSIGSCACRFAGRRCVSSSAERGPTGTI